jgi:hypothetical protein
MTLLTRFEPFREFSTMQDRMNRLFRESYSPEGPEEGLTTERRTLRPLVVQQSETLRAIALGGEIVDKDHFYDRD